MPAHTRLNEINPRLLEIPIISHFLAARSASTLNSGAASFRPIPGRRGRGSQIPGFKIQEIRHPDAVFWISNLEPGIDLNTGAENDSALPWTRTTRLPGTARALTGVAQSDHRRV